MFSLYSHAEVVLKAFRFGNILVLVLFIVLTAFAATQISKIKIDSSTEVFIPDRHEIKKINKDIENEFGSLDSIMLGIQTEYGSVTDKPVLDLISEITSRIEKDKRASQVMSLTNMDYIRGLDNGIQVVPLYDSSDSEATKKLNDRLLDWKDVYFGTFLSENRKLAAIIVQPVKNSDEAAVKGLYRNIKSIASEYEDGNLSFHVAGFAVVKDELNRSLVKDVYWLIPAAAGLILLMLFISFRRWEAVVFPIICLLNLF